MKIKIISIGKVKNNNILNLCNDYRQRIMHSAKIDEVIFKNSTKESENKKIVSHLLKSKDYKIALSQDGEIISSENFAKILSKMNDRSSCFIIGGSDGLNNQTKSNCDKIISLSPMTFTHELAKLFLLEQIYRSITIIQNKKYHK
ncbi:MAG: 23S rRNA (pseudouridine(1915)-N(3))-methyltransferase RlmH [Candidatus Neomarinimicrobiota bacterium]|nr:23S rRNA (pseudouridine(1915)-N(3))-methyltransferase RlmH [Candidatus Neomarinimicrobiota bacterium]|tara:strand:- start:489 stop:923 length:435 start_codon:yes stop_codon:yes gene_type:complete